MSDVEKLLAAFEDGSLVRPRADSPNIVDLSRAIASLMGVEGLPPSHNSSELSELIGPSDHLIFIMADGLGMNLFRRLAEGSFLSQHLKVELQTVFPSTTAVVLASIATGEWPNKHAVTGWWTHLPELKSAAAILQYVRRSDRRPLDAFGIEAKGVFPVRPLMSCARRETLACFPEHICESVPSIYFSGHRPRLASKSFSDAVDKAVKAIEEAISPTYTYIYTHLVDGVAHLYGTGRPEIQGALNEVDREIARLHAELKGKARIVVSADHGFLDAPQTARHQIRVSDTLMEWLRYPPSGDARVLYLHVHEGRNEQVREYFQKRFSERFFLISTDEAEELRLLGPDAISPLVRERVGDMMAISRGLDVIEYRSGGGIGRVLTQTSQHSGLSPQEMRVPLVVV